MAGLLQRHIYLSETIKGARNRMRSFLRPVNHTIYYFFGASLADPRPFAVLRIGVSFALIVQALQVSPVYLELYGENGLIQGSLAFYLADPALPSLFWLGGQLTDFWVLGLGISYILALVAVILGWQTRLATVFACVLHWLLVNTGSSHNYGADQLAQVSLFYLMLVPTRHAWSLDHLLRRRDTIALQFTAGAVFRLMQLHLCIVYLASGLEKATGEQWRNGEAIWRSLMMPVYNQFDVSWVASWPSLAQAGGWLTLAVEIGYPIFIWPKRTRPVWLLLTVGMHIGIAVTLGLHVFALLMIALNLGLFAAPLVFHECHENVSNIG